jgi:UDP:flavonoid glycosyltransferase YjiC (YdhE family)
MKTILFAWELGRGLGHLMNLRRIGQRLKAHGLHLVAAVPDPSQATLLQDIFDAIIAAPAWPPEPDAASTSSATLHDILASSGLADAMTVQRLLAAWDGLFAQMRPSLVIADFAPAAALAAQHRLPLLWIGNGYTLPPPEMQRFPLLHRLAPPVWNEDATLAIINTALQSIGRGPIQHLPQIFSGDACLVQTFALLDPYDMQRVGEVDGPLLDRIPAPRSDAANLILAYLSGGYDLSAAILQGLKPFAKRLRLYAPTLPAPQIADFRSAGTQIMTTVEPLADSLASAALFVHRGGSGSAAEALVAGVPQLILSAQIEQDLTGEALQRSGVGRLIKSYEPTAELPPAQIETMLGDQTLAATAARLATAHRAVLETTDALAHCEAVCLRLLVG